MNVGRNEMTEGDSVSTYILMEHLSVDAMLKIYLGFAPLLWWLLCVDFESFSSSGLL